MAGTDKEALRRQFAPSPEKLIPEEAEDPHVRANANLFIERAFQKMDEAELSFKAWIPTPEGITDSYKATIESLWQSGQREHVFTLREAYGAAKRKLLFQKELAAECVANGISSSKIAMKNIGNMYTLMTAIELTFPENQRPR